MIVPSLLSSIEKRTPHYVLSLYPFPHFFVAQVAEAHIQGHLILPDFPVHYCTPHFLDLEPIECFEGLICPGDRISHSLINGIARDADNFGNYIRFILHTLFPLLLMARIEPAISKLTSHTRRRARP